MQNCNGTLIFDDRPRIGAFASVAGKKEAQGPLREDFDRIIYDSYFDQDTFEKAETEMMRTAVEIAIEKGDMEREDIDLAFCGDLLNQCVASSFAMSGFGIPYAGVYGACSTMALGLMMSAIAVESGAAMRAVCAASSHYCTAERQYRMPLEYGSQRPPTAQWTVTGCGACIVESDSETAKKSVGADCDSMTTKSRPAGKNPNSSRINGNKNSYEKKRLDTTCRGNPRTPLPNAHMPYIRAARPGIITDLAVTDPNNMGAAMAPAVVKIGTQKI